MSIGAMLSPRRQIELSDLMAFANITAEVSANGFHSALDNDAQSFPIDLHARFPLAVGVMSVSIDRQTVGALNVSVRASQVC